MCAKKPTASDREGTRHRVKTLLSQNQCERTRVQAAIPTSFFSRRPIEPTPTIPRRIDDMTKFPGSGVTKPTCDCTRRPELAQFCSDQCCDKRSAFVKDQLRKRINIDCCGACYRTVQRKSKHKLDAISLFGKIVQARIRRRGPLASSGRIRNHGIAHFAVSQPV